MNENLGILITTGKVLAYAFGGSILLTLAFRKTNWGRNMTAAIIMWAVIFGLFIMTSYTSWLAFTILIILLSYGAIREFYTMTGVFSRTSMIIAAAMLLLMSIALLYERKDIFDIVPLISVTLLLPLQMTRHGTADFNRKSSLRLLGLIYWGWLPMHFVLIQKPKGGFGAIVLLCMLIATNDNGAYYTGKLLGKNSPKLLPSVSPGKTWTGFIGGGVITIGAAAALGYTLPGSNVWQRMLLGLIVAIVGPIGDLLESAMKRDAGVKDSGKLIPGHGGVMDRFDSWAFTAPLYYYFLLAYGWL